MCSPAEEPTEVIQLPTEHFLTVHMQEDGGPSLSIDIPLVVNERGYPEIKGQRTLEKEKGDSGLFTRIRLEMRSPVHCVGCDRLLSGVPAELQFEVQVRMLVFDFEEGEKPQLGEQVAACHDCIRKALKDPEEGLAGMPILFEAKPHQMRSICEDRDCKIKGDHVATPECGP